MTAPDHHVRPFPEALSIERRKRRLTHREVADRCGVAVDEVKRWESGESIPEPKIFVRLRNTSFRSLWHYRSELEHRWRSNGADKHDVNQAILATTPSERDLEQPQPEEVDDSPGNAIAFDDALRRARIREGITQYELADLVGVNQGSISSWERAASVPIAAHYEKLLELLPELAAAPPPAGRDGEKPGRPLGADPVGGRNGARNVEGIPVPLRPDHPEPSAAEVAAQAHLNALIAAEGARRELAVAARTLDAALERYGAAQAALAAAQEAIEVAHQALIEAARAT